MIRICGTRIVGSAAPGDSYSDIDWYNALFQQASVYAGAAPDLYDVESWVHIPRTTVPEWQPFSFMYSLRKVLQYNFIRVPSTVAPGHLWSNEDLYPDQYRCSSDEMYCLVYQSDGNLVLYTHTGYPVWASGTSGTAPGMATMQGDGNLVIYDSYGNPVWDSGTWGNNGAYLSIDPTGWVEIRSGSGTRLWSQPY